MKNLYILLILVIASGCTVLNIGTVPDTYNVASHNEDILIYRSFYSKKPVKFIPANTNFRVNRTVKKSRKNNKRRIYYNGHSYWVVVLIFNNEKDFATWAHEETMKQIGSTTNSSQSSTPSSNHIYHTGPRGGQYYINSNGNKVYKKRN